MGAEINELQWSRLAATMIYVQIQEVFPDTHGEFLSIEVLAEYLRKGTIPDEAELG